MRTIEEEANEIEEKNITKTNLRIISKTYAHSKKI